MSKKNCGEWKERAPTSYRRKLVFFLFVQLAVLPLSPKAPDLQTFFWLQTDRNQNLCRWFGLSIRLHVTLTKSKLGLRWD